ncbi:GCN5 family acetyltransferase [Flavobacterium beibuense F44-8]|uniref:GCN5 family acetyltransferase n=1 Tax=Flavobacterium beibuense F44-8 TaxID=1406840 RepID=A0A0A2LIC6_9FLAO|nr:GNAT family N-acetyltransferase [Flavobacterium beibuense]KGO78948.1 GCN5 family acetyltransferase [Flavobacterium beibuense F44-8]
MLTDLTYREALVTDIPQIQYVRHTVKENILSNPELVKDSDVEDYITRRGKGWIAIVNNTIVGFAIVSTADNNVWALFILPEFENKGIGKTLHNIMMDWYFSQTQETIWLSTGTGTRAETFYRLKGWENIGAYGTQEIKFIMAYKKWLSLMK